MICERCGSDNRENSRFCRKCGQAFDLVCPACRRPAESDAHFCAGCGTSFANAAPDGTQRRSGSERRLVSVLFADLVGFTSLSEARDAEEVRELLDEYYVASREVVGRHGGTIQKFIGDAVMAVWGAPIAFENDAERAVRTALDLVAAVERMGTQLGSPDLQLRVGVLTGEAAVELDAVDRGMVIGDAVNTAARLQSLAPPGGVLVDSATRSATERVVAYEDAGSHMVKGKQTPVHAWRAARVIASVGGSLRASGIDAPLLGRDTELAELKSVLNAVLDSRSARVAVVLGEAGIGKSRLAWELEKYADGVTDQMLWHRGRCPAYGDGLAFYPLAEMIRLRCEIEDTDNADIARAKLVATVTAHVAVARDRDLIIPRLAFLLGLAATPPGDQADLFSGWRLFIERMAEHAPVVMVVEDVQWSDEGLVRFVEHVSEWSAHLPILFVLLARSDALDRWPELGAGRPGWSQLMLGSLEPGDMQRLLQGLVPGIPTEALAKIESRAGGVPLYAVEIARMLLDRGLITRDAHGYTLQGPIEELAVPETLQALVAARLDELAAEQRGVIRDASVLGLTFTVQALVAISGLAEIEANEILSGLVGKELLRVDSNPRSADHGQYVFVHAIVQRVAYGMLARRDRRARHLAAVEALGKTMGDQFDDTVAAVHLLAAIDADPQAADADSLRSRAQKALIRAADHAAGLGSMAEAARDLARAAELEPTALAQADLLERAGMAASAAADASLAVSYLETAAAAFGDAGDTRRAMRSKALAVEAVGWDADAFAEQIQTLREAYEVLSGERDRALAEVAAKLGQFELLVGNGDGAAEPIETALEIAEALWLPQVMAEALDAKFKLLHLRGRPIEAEAVLRGSLEVSLANNLARETMRAYNNTAFTEVTSERWTAALDTLDDALTLAQHRGDRPFRDLVLGVRAYPLYMLGRWGDALDLAGSLEPGTFFALEAELSAILIVVHRGDVGEAASRLVSFERFASSVNEQLRKVFETARAIVLGAQGNHAEAFDLARGVLDDTSYGLDDPYARERLLQALDSGLAIGEFAGVESLSAAALTRPAFAALPYFSGQIARFRARTAVLRGEDPSDIDEQFEAARVLLGQAGVPWAMAMVELEFAEWLDDEGRAEEGAALRRRSETVFAALEADPWHRRALGEPLRAAQ